jgi:hypothetical protein
MTLHLHAHLALFANGRQRAIPRSIGIPARTPPCIYWLHTHDASGVLHIEASKHKTLTLGDFFKLWGEPLSRTQVGPYRGAVTVFVDGKRWPGDPNAVKLKNLEQIVLEVGREVAPPVYALPAGMDR